MLSLDLSAAVDVYSDWVDACDSVAKEDTKEAGGGQAQARRSLNRGGGNRDSDRDMDDDDDRDVEGYEGDGIVADDDDY